MTEVLPVDVREAAIQVCGTAFLYKDPLRSVFVNAGVSGEDFDRLSYQGLAKFSIAREVFASLEARGQRGREIQHELVRQLMLIREPMREVHDRAAGVEALARLRTAAERIVDVRPNSEPELSARRKQKELRDAARKANERRLTRIREQFTNLSVAQTGVSPQQRGYAFEDFLAELFSAHDIPYRRSFRVGSVEQIDGAFKLNGRDYLVEARWRQQAPDLGELAEFAYKVEAKVDATRGFFISMVPPRPEVVEALLLRTKRVLIMDGSDIATIVEGIVSLRDALEQKEDCAAHEGVIFHQLGRANAA